jgi:hypothetical protein
MKNIFKAIALLALLISLTHLIYTNAHQNAPTNIITALKNHESDIVIDAAQVL